MPDREKVVTGLEALNSAIKRRVDDADDAYGFVAINLKYYQTVKDALALLKAQEPINPIMVKGARSTYLKCGHCYAWLPQNEKPNYCSNCGKAVKWE